LQILDHFCAVDSFMHEASGGAAQALAWEQRGTPQRPYRFLASISDFMLP
jgi:hypothetical protein